MLRPREVSAFAPVVQTVVDDLLARLELLRRRSPDGATVPDLAAELYKFGFEGGRGFRLGAGLRVGGLAVLPPAADVLPPCRYFCRPVRDAPRLPAGGNPCRHAALHRRRQRHADAVRPGGAAAALEPRAPPLLGTLRPGLG